MACLTGLKRAYVRLKRRRGENTVAHMGRVQAWKCQLILPRRAAELDFSGPCGKYQTVILLSVLVLGRKSWLTTGKPVKLRER